MMMEMTKYDGLYILGIGTEDAEGGDWMYIDCNIKGNKNNNEDGEIKIDSNKLLR